MPNPRFMSERGVPTTELLEKLTLAKQVIQSNIDWFSEKYAQDPNELGRVDGVYLIGSHAKETGWLNETSDVDFKIVNGSPELIPNYLHTFKREVLRPLLCRGEKHRWIDIYFVQREDQVLHPRYDLTTYWNNIASRAGD